MYLYSIKLYFKIIIPAFDHYTLEGLKVRMKILLINLCENINFAMHVGGLLSAIQLQKLCCRHKFYLWMHIMRLPLGFTISEKEFVMLFFEHTCIC